MADLLGYGGTAGLNGPRPGRMAMAAGDPVIEQIAAHPWPRGGVQVRRVRGGYTLTSARTGAPVARLKPLPTGDRVEVLWWRRDAWGPAGPFGAVLSIGDALAFIAAEPAFWIRA
ncbi:MAG: hypothetical protein M3N04_02190 [Actinomycetota bacterium]|nr:hypothetical protein [Actinomycetota bacterium]